MHFSNEHLEELNLLSHFNLDSTQEGIKVHSSASPEMVAAAKRLFVKGLTSQVDGGYLTSLGIIAAEHTQSLIHILTPLDQQPN